ncbi:MAG: zinc-ribbon domain-containing protein [Bacilli bacterium]|nr:zinc-ribbon domain-containing protein [Bacilli bacterium]
MKCPRCQKEVNDDNQFCPYCGQKLHNEDNLYVKQLKEARFNQFSFIMNRILNIATFISVLFVLIGIFGPILTFSNATTSVNIGGLEWFAYSGWRMLQDGMISVGPFYLTFVLYIVISLASVGLVVHAVYTAINSLRKNDKCKTVPHIIVLSIARHIYSAIIYNFYYEEMYSAYGMISYGDGWGDTTYYVTIPFFTIGLIAYLIVRALHEHDTKVTLTTIFGLICSFSFINLFNNAFILLSYQNIHTGEAFTYGTLHYFDILSNPTTSEALCIILMEVLGALVIINGVIYAIFTIKKLVKHEKINKELTLVCAINNFVFVIAMLVINGMFGSVVNAARGSNNIYFSIHGNLLGLLFSSLLILGLSIAMFALNVHKKDDVNNNVIDQPVIEKEDA